MAGSSEAAKRAVATNRAKDPDHYKKIGRLGGKAGTKKGFYLDREFASRAGRIGGSRGKRSKLKPTLGEAEVATATTDEYRS